MGTKKRMAKTENYRKTKTRKPGDPVPTPVTECVKRTALYQNWPPWAYQTPSQTSLREAKFHCRNPKDRSMAGPCWHVMGTPPYHYHTMIFTGLPLVTDEMGFY